MSNLRWRRYFRGGFELVELRQSTVVNNLEFEFAQAIVYRAKRGNRWVVRVYNYKAAGPQFTNHAATSVREAMRLAKFLVGVRNG